MKGLSSSGSTDIIGTLTNATEVAVRAYRNSGRGYIYFSLKGTPLEGRTPQNIGRVAF